MTTIRAMTVAQVSQVERSVDFYSSLGFAPTGVYGEPAGVAIMQRGDVTIMLQLADKVQNVGGRWFVYVYVDDLPALHREFLDAGMAPTDIRYPDYYGCDDFDVTDPDGHVIAFGQSRDPTPGPGLSEHRGKG